jgi:hypothetical protein
MSILRIIPSPKVVTASWIAIAVVGTVMIACTVYAALYGVASSDFLVGP